MYMNNVKELLQRLKDGAIELENIKSDFYLKNQVIKSIDDMIFISNTYIKLLDNFVKSEKKESDITSDEKEKIKIMSEHYKLVKKVIYDFSKA